MATVSEFCEEVSRLAVEAAPVAMVIADQCGKIVLINRQTELLFGYRREELIAASVDMLVPDRFREQHPKHRDAFLAKPTAVSLGAGRDLNGRRKDGTEFPIEIGLNPIETRKGTFVLSAIVDITERTQTADQRDKAALELAALNRELSLLGRVDTLTGLLVRGAWEEALTMEQARSTRHHRPYSVILIDVDCFKLLNDTQGHDAGDDALRMIASCVAENARTIDAVGRYGGEELVVLLPATTGSAALVLAERIRQAIFVLNLPHGASLAEDRVTVSLGVASSAGGSAKEVLKRADVALYAAKELGRNRVVADGSCSDLRPPHAAAEPSL